LRFHTQEHCFEMSPRREEPGCPSIRAGLISGHELISTEGAGCPLEVNDVETSAPFRHTGGSGGRSDANTYPDSSCDWEGSGRRTRGSGAGEGACPTDPGTKRLISWPRNASAGRRTWARGLRS